MLAFFILWAPTVLGLVFLVAAGILFARVRSLATGLFFVGALVTILAPWAFQLTGGSEHSRPVVMVRPDSSGTRFLLLRIVGSQEGAKQLLTLEKKIRV